MVDLLQYPFLLLIPFKKIAAMKGQIFTDHMFTINMFLRITGADIII